MAVSPLAAQIQKYSDPSTELDVYRLTDPRFSSYLPAPYQHAVSRRGSVLMYSSDRGGGALQAFHLNPRTGEAKQMTNAAALDPSSLTWMPDDRSFCYFDGPSLRHSLMRDREVYRVPEGWERCPGFTVTDDGLHAVLSEKQGGKSRLRLVVLAKGVVSTVVESPGIIETPLPRPKRAQILYRHEGLWLVNFDGQQNRPLKTESAGPYLWAPSGRTVLYLHIPGDTHELNTIREHTPDENADKPLAKTSQFVAFAANADSSVFVGASRNKASPTVLLLLRVTRREFTLCEHHASDPATVSPVFSPNSQNIYFQSDREGKPAIYRMRVDKLVEETGDPTIG